MQRTGRNHWLTWTLAGWLVAMGSGVTSAQSPSKPSGSTRSGATANNRNNTRQSAMPAPGRPAQANSRVPTPAPVPTTNQSPARGKPAAAQPARVSNQDGSGKVMLQHRLKMGEIVRMQTIHVANTMTRIQGTEDVSESKTVSDKVWEIHSVDADGLITFEYRIDGVEMSQKQGDKDEITYNSRTDKEVPQIFSRVAETIAKPIAIVTIDPSGTVIERDNQSKTPPLGMGELAMPLPKEPVAVGAQWSIPRECRVKLEDGTQKVMKLREQYTLEKVSAGIATIRIQSQPLTPVEDPSVEAQLMQQMSQGVAKFDIDRGRMIHKQLDWEDDVVGFRGAETALEYTARYTEELMPEETAPSRTRSARNPAATSRK